MMFNFAWTCQACQQQDCFCECVLFLLFMEKILERLIDLSDFFVKGAVLLVFFILASTNDLEKHVEHD